MAKGWISLHRDIIEMDGYFGERFNRPMCFIDLLLLAEWREEGRVFFIRGNKVVVGRGQVAISVRELCDRWGIPLTTTKRRLAEMIELGRITIKHSKVINVITIVNYNRYQNDDGLCSESCLSENSCKSIENKGDTKQNRQQSGQQNGQQSGPQSGPQNGPQNGPQSSQQNGLSENSCKSIENKGDTKQNRPQSGPQSGPQNGQQNGQQSSQPINNINNINKLVVVNNAREEKFLRDFFCHQIAVEQFCMNNGITVDECKRIAKEITAEWALNDEPPEAWTKKHLTNTIRIKLEAERKRAKAQAQQPKSREQWRAELEASARADYILGKQLGKQNQI